MEIRTQRGNFTAVWLPEQNVYEVIGTADGLAWLHATIRSETDLLPVSMTMAVWPMPRALWISCIELLLRDELDATVRATMDSTPGAGLDNEEVLIALYRESVPGNFAPHVIVRWPDDYASPEAAIHALRKEGLIPGGPWACYSVTRALASQVRAHPLLTKLPFYDGRSNMKNTNPPTGKIIDAHGDVKADAARGGTPPQPGPLVEDETLVGGVDAETGAPVIRPKTPGGRADESTVPTDRREQGC